jgi:hypothetical protein
MIFDGLEIGTDLREAVATAGRRGDERGRARAVGVPARVRSRCRSRVASDRPGGIATLGVCKVAYVGERR